MSLWNGKPSRFFQDYEKGPDGHFVYKGAYYRVRPGTDFCRYSRINSLWVLGMVACFVFCGCLPTSSLQAAYVTVPFLCGLLPIAVCAWDVGHIAFSKQRLPQPDHEKYVERLRVWTGATFLLAAAATVGQTGYLLFGFIPGKLGIDLLFLVGVLGLALCSLFFFLYQRQSPWVPDGATHC